MRDARQHNRRFWDEQARSSGQWSTPVTPEAIHAARCGNWQVHLTPLRPVPDEWLLPIDGRDLLGLAAGGGQQGPIFAAAGARTTVFDFSTEQLAKDRSLAEEHGLDLRTVEGDVTDLSAFDDDTFDVVFHPCASMYVDDVRAVWREAHRVLRAGGTLLAGFNNPAVYIFDWSAHVEGRLVVRHPLPFSDARDLPDEEREHYIEQGMALEYSHTFDEQIGGQLEAGFEIIGFYEDRQPGLEAARYMPTAFATWSRARKNR
jgi:SAM-dependent methyltransferase